MTHHFRRSQIDELVCIAEVQEYRKDLKTNNALAQLLLANYTKIDTIKFLDLIEGPVRIISWDKN